MKGRRRVGPVRDSGSRSSTSETQDQGPDRTSGWRLGVGGRLKRSGKGGASLKTGLGVVGGPGVTTVKGGEGLVFGETLRV